MSDNLVRGLQSRTAKRGKHLAYLESVRSGGRAFLKMARAVGLSPQDLQEPREALREVRRDIRNLAADQKLDRELLRTLHNTAAKVRYQQLLVADLMLTV